MKRFEALAECADALVFVTGLSMRMVFANSALARETGFTAADFQFPQADNPFIHRDDAERVARFIGDFIASNARVSDALDNRFLDRWGRTHRYRSVITKVSHSGESALLFVCRELGSPVASEGDDRQYRALVESADDAIVRLDAHGRFLYANRQMYDSLGYSAIELGRLCMCELVSKADRDAFAEQLAGCRGATAPARFELLLVAKDGRELCTHVVLSSLARFGAPSELLAILRDVTAEKCTAKEQSALEERMREAQKLETLGLLAGGIAHDFNNLLAAVMGNVGLCRKHLANGRNIDTLLDETERASKRAAALCSQMLAYAGKSKLVVGPVDLNALVSEMTELTRAAVTKRAIFRVALGADLPSVRGDVVQLQQILMNLLTNASEALGDRDGDVTIETGACHLNGQGAVYLRVTDTGCGMEESTRTRMFDPFFTTKSEGRGLGLAAVRGVIQSLNGGLRVDSQPGRGTCIEVTLPTASVDEKTADRSTPLRPTSAGWRGHGTIVLADDENALRRVVATLLKDAGFTVVEVADGVAAIDAARRHRHTLTALVLDLTMPGLGGVEALRTLRRDAVDTPAVLMTGYAAEMSRAVSHAELGPVQWLGKPFLVDEMLGAVRTAVEGNA